jgi:ATP-dependent DNA helicase RecQ
VGGSGGRGSTSALAGVGGGAGAAVGSASEEQGEPVDEGQFEALKTWRFERAEGKPAFTVAANTVLEEILRRRPRSLDELIEIRGIGPAFCEKHGESLLAALDALDGAGAVGVA